MTIAGAGSRLAGALALVLAATTFVSGATTDESPPGAVQQLESNLTQRFDGVVASQTGTCRSDTALALANVRGVPPVVEGAIGIWRRLDGLFGGHPLSAGLAFHKEVLGVADGRTVADRYVDVHVNLSLMGAPAERCSR